MSVKGLLIAALVIVLALCPSVTECINAHEQGHPRLWLFWGWIILVSVLAVAAGEELMGVG